MGQSLSSSVIITLAFNCFLTSLLLFKQLFSLNTSIFVHPTVSAIAYKVLELQWQCLGGYSELNLETSSAASGLISLHCFCSRTEEALKCLHSIKKLRTIRKYKTSTSKLFFYLLIDMGNQLYRSLKTFLKVLKAPHTLVGNIPIHLHYWIIPQYHSQFKII